MSSTTPKLSLNYVWDFNTLSWVRQTQSGSVPGAAAVDIVSDSVGLARQSQLPSTLGQKASSASTSVVIASDQSPIAVTGSITTTGEVEIKNDSGNPIPVSGTVTSNLGTIAGVATETTLSAINTKIPASPSEDRVLATNAHAARLTDGVSFYKATTPADTQPVSATSLPLPTGASTETTLAAINTKIPAAPSTAGLQTAGNSSLSSIDTKTPALGQAVMASSVPVAIASNQSAIPISGTVTVNQPVAVTDNGGSITVDGTVSSTQSGTWNITNVSGTISLPTGASTSALQTTTNSSLSSIDSKTPSLGQALMAASTPIVIASNQTTVPVSVASLPLPTGAATEATLSSLNSKVTVVNTGAVVVSSSALPTGAATAALQTQPGVDIGDVTINNASGAAAVNIQDGGNSITVDGTVSTVISSTVSTNNSTTAPLGTGGTFTGTSDDVLNFAGIVISVFSNVASATDGLSIQQSSNGTNWDVVDTFTIAAATGRAIEIPPAARFFRIVYTNGGTLQTTFRLQTIFKQVATNASSSRATDTYTNETDLQQVQSFLMGYNGTTWDRLRNDTANGLDVDVTRVTGTVTIAGTVNIKDSTGDNIDTGQQTAANSLPVVIATNQTAIPIVGTYAEDSASANTDQGLLILGIRNDNLNSRTNNDGDYIGFATDDVGRLLIKETATSVFSNGTQTTVAGTAVQIQAANTTRRRLIVQNTGSANIRVGIAAVSATTGVRLVPGETLIFQMPYVETSAIFAIREGATSSTVNTVEST